MIPRMLLLAAVALAGCNQIELPDYFASGRDSRVYNAQTGQYEWPDSEPKRTPYKPRVNPNEPDEPAKPLFNTSDERVFNPQTGRYEWPQP